MFPGFDDTEHPASCAEVSEVRIGLHGADQAKRD